MAPSLDAAFKCVKKPGATCARCVHAGRRCKCARCVQGVGANVRAGAGGTFSGCGSLRVASVQLLPRPPPERPPLSSQWSRRCRQSRRTQQVSSDTLDTVSRWRHGNWRRHSRKTQDVGHRETGTHETQTKLIRRRMSRRSSIGRRRWAVVESHGQPRLLEALVVTPPHPPSDPQNHPTTIRLPACNLESIPPLWDVSPVRPKFCLLSEDR